MTSARNSKIELEFEDEDDDLLFNVVNECKVHYNSLPNFWFITSKFFCNALSLSLCNAGQVPVNVLVIMLISPVSSETAAYFVWSRGTYIAYAKTTATEKMSRHWIPRNVLLKWKLLASLHKTSHRL